MDQGYEVLFHIVFSVVHWEYDRYRGHDFSAPSTKTRQNSLFPCRKVAPDKLFQLFHIRPEESFQFFGHIRWNFLRP